MAKEAGFEIRKSKIDGYKFLSTIIKAGFSDEKLSLNDLSISLALDYGIQVSKQGIDYRLNAFTCKFFKAVLEKIISEVIGNKYRLNAPFQALKIKDSTCFQLPEQWANEYPGSGGSSSKAAIRIQFEYDLLSGKITDLTIHPFNNPDIKNAEATVDNLNEKELIIRDLAYWSSPMSQLVNNKKCFFIAKVSPSTNVYLKEDKGARLDFEALFSKMIKNKIDYIDKPGAITEDGSEFRLVVQRVPSKVYQERLKKAKKLASKKGKAISKEKKRRMWFNIFITNIESKQYQWQDILNIYKIRWQIELIFKTWKSFSDLAKIKSCKVERFKCLLYAKLIKVTLQCKLILYIFTSYLVDLKQAMSYIKLSKLLSPIIKDVWSYCNSNKETLTKYLEKVFNIAYSKCKFEKRKNKLSSFEIIQIITDKMRLNHAKY